VNECRSSDGRKVAAIATIFSIFIILFSYIGIVNLDHVFYNPVNAQEGITTNYNITDLNSTQNGVSLIKNILAKNLENHIQKAGAIFEITSKLPQVRNLSYAHLLNQILNTLHGIPQNADLEKRQVVRIFWLAIMTCMKFSFLCQMEICTFSSLILYKRPLV